MNLTPLQLMLIAIVIMFLCFLLKHLVEANKKRHTKPFKTPPAPTPPSPKTCNDWLKNNTCSDTYIPVYDRTECEYDECSDKDCCLKDNPDSDDVSTYCLDEVTDKSGKSLQYCLNNLPNYTCGLNRNISFDTCKKAKERPELGGDDLGLAYCEFRDNAGQYCTSDDHRICYCFRNHDAQLENCKDNETTMKSRRYDISGLTAH